MTTTKTIQISKEYVVAQIKHLAETEPNRTNGGLCSYQRQECNQLHPNCIVGQILFNAGVSVDVLRELDSSEETSAISAVIDRLAEHYVFIDSEAVEVLTWAQEAADQSSVGELPWRYIPLQIGLT